jgi:putative nucleotidyltransferase with HDIG domain
MVYRIFLTLLCISIIVSLFPKEGKFQYEFQKNKPWLHEDLIAPFDFAINKSDEELSREKSEILKNFKYYFKVDSKVYSLVKAKAIQQLKSDCKGSCKKEEQYLQRLLQDVYSKGIITMNAYVENKPADYSIFIVKNNVATFVSLRDLYTIKTVFEKVNAELLLIPSLNKNLIVNALENNLQQNIIYDDAMTKKVQQSMISTISPNKDMKQRGQRIVSRGDMVDEEKYKVLSSLKKEYMLQIGGNVNHYFVWAGQFLLTFICLMMIVLFLYNFRIEVLNDNYKFTFILITITLMVAMASISYNFHIISIYMLPFCLLPVLVRAFLDTRTALFTHLSTMLMIGLVSPNPFEFVFIQIIGGIFAIFSIVDLRNRIRLFVSVGVIFGVYSLTYAGIVLIKEGRFNNFDFIYLESFAISAGLTLFAYPLIFIFEKIFGFISDVSLMELADINSPLLRELGLKAPGTFQHSIQVANLAEEAIIKIGGSSMLVRVGALYHDVGKISMPNYFIENQFTGVNPHSEMSSTESANIVINHVKQGIKLAKQYNIPEPIIDFIRTHHGTTKAEYFYKTYQQNADTEEPIDEAAFKYPGPLPFSKETAVLMMADSVEAASRSLKTVDAENINRLVDRIIDHQMEENQFINAPITFKEFTELKKIFKRKLININHLRIEYPK